MNFENKKKMKFCLYTLFQFEDAVKEVADEITQPRPEGEETVQDIQITLRSNANPIPMRNLKVVLLLFNVFQKYTCSKLTSIINKFILILIII